MGGLGSQVKKKKKGGGGWGGKLTTIRQEGCKKGSDRTSIG